MIVSHMKDIKGTDIKSPEAKDALMKVLISPEEGWNGYVMRTVELDEGGYSPQHRHPWPHINYIIKGKGLIHLDGKNYEVEEGSFAYIPDDKIHQFKNKSKEKFIFICIVPEKGHQ